MDHNLNGSSPSQGLPDDDLQNYKSTLTNNLLYPQSTTIILSIVVGLISLITILGNLTVIISFIRDPKLRKVRNYYLINLAICDLTVGCFVTEIALLDELFLVWHWGLTFCKIWLCINCVVLFESVMTILLICWDRVLLTSHPLQYMAHQTPRRALLKIILTWIFSIAFQCPSIFLNSFNISSAVIKNCDAQILHETPYTGVKTTLEYAIPLILMIAMNFKIYHNIRKKTLKYSSRQRVIRFKDAATPQGPSVATISQMCGIRENLLQPVRQVQNHPCVYMHVNPNCVPTPVNLNSYQQCTCSHQTFKDGVSKMAALSIQYSVLPIDWWPWEGHHRQIGNFKMCRLADPWPACPTNTSINTLPPHLQNVQKHQHKWTIFQSKPHILPRSRVRAKKLRRLKRFLVLLVTVYIICWTPYVITTLVEAAGSKCISDNIHRFLYWGLYINSTVNPFLYALILRRYSMNFRRIWCPCRKQEKKPLCTFFVEK